MEKKLQRIPHEGAIAGVCAGLAAYFNIDKTWVRLAFILSVFFSGYMGIGLLGPIVYIVLWIVLPVKAFSLQQDPFDVDYRTPGYQQPPVFEKDSPYQGYTGAVPPPRTKNSKDRSTAGLILLVLGLFFLLHQLNVFYWRDLARYWPVLIIIMGLTLILGSFNQKEKRAFSNQKPQEPEQMDDNEPRTHTS